jgi:hypothetical protein
MLSACKTKATIMYGEKKRHPDGHAVWVLMPERVLKNRDRNKKGDKWIDEMTAQEWQELESELEPCTSALSHAEYQQLPATPKPKGKAPPSRAAGAAKEAGTAHKRKSAASLALAKGMQVAVELNGQWQQALVKEVVEAADGESTKVLLDYTKLPASQRNEPDEWLLASSTRLKPIKGLPALHGLGAERSKRQRSTLANHTNQV